MILAQRKPSVLRNSVVIVNSSEEEPIKVTLIKCDNLSHLKGSRNSCSLTNCWCEKDIAEVMKKHRTHFITLRLIRLHALSCV